MSLKNLGLMKSGQISLKNLKNPSKKLLKPNSSNSNNFSLKSLVQIAKDRYEPNTASFEGLEQFLIQWFCDHNKVRRDSDILVNSTIEELALEYMVHCMKYDKEYYERIMHDGEDSYERWLKEQMGEEYETDHQNTQTLLKEQENYSKKIQEQFPDKIETDFTKVGIE